MNKTNNVKFEEVEKYVVAKGENFNDDRYIEIMVNGVEVTLCMDEDNKVIQVLTADGEVIDNSNKGTTEECLEKLIEDSKIVVYTIKEERFWDLYMNEIRPETECPEIDDTMLIIRF